MSPGDVLMLTAAVRDLHNSHPGRFNIDVSTPFPDLWENNPYLSKLDPAASDVETVTMHYPAIHDSNEGSHHFIHGYRLFLEQELGVRIHAGKLWGDIHLSEKEKGWISMIHEHFTGQDTPFWLICTGGKMDYTAKWWIPEFAQEKARLNFALWGARLQSCVYIKKTLRPNLRAQAAVCHCTVLDCSWR